MPETLDQPPAAELFTRKQAANRQKCSVQTIINWEERDWLALAAERPKRYTAEALDAAAKKADDARHKANIKASRAALKKVSKRQRLKNILAAQKKGVATRWPKPKEGQGSTRDAAVWAGLSRKAIEKAHENGELKAASENPLRFERSEVDRYTQTLEKSENDLAIIDIPLRLPGPPGKIFKTRDCEKLTRVRNIINKLGIETYLRRATAGGNQRRKLRCIREERFAEVQAEYLARTTFAADEMSPGEIKICDAAAEYFPDQFVRAATSTIIERLAEHAPDSVRTVTHGTAGRYKAKVAPRAAIEAALRGEAWTPSAETTSIEPTDGNAASVPKALPTADTEDASAFVPASTLWRDRFPTYRKFKWWLTNTPEAEVRRRSPRSNRLELHAADWARYWDAFDRSKFDALDR